MFHFFSAIKADLQKIENAYKALREVNDDLANCFVCAECGRTSVDTDGCCVHCGRDCMQFVDGALVATYVTVTDAIEAERDQFRKERDEALEEIQYLRNALSEPVADERQIKSAWQNTLNELAELKQLEAKRGEVFRDLLDALSMPHGRNVRAAWAKACLLFGRYDRELSLGAFVSYWEDLKPGAFFDYLMKAAQEMGAKKTSE